MIPTSIPRASNVRSVSYKVSPFAREEDSLLKFKTSAPSRLAATSKENLVRVEFSKKRFAIIFPSRILG